MNLPQTDLYAWSDTVIINLADENEIKVHGGNDEKARLYYEFSYRNPEYRTC